MSITDEIRRQTRELHNQNYRAVRIEIGEKQARALADEWNACIVPHKFDPVLMARLNIQPEPEPDRITWQQIMRGPSTLYGTPVVGVESPDYLLVVAGEPAQ